jgi:hypothetical protein
MRAAAGRRESWTFLVWALVGTLAMLGVLSILTVGVFVLPLAGILAVVTVRRFGMGAAALGLVAGLGLPLAYVGWLNRGGPGEVCRATADGTSCTTEWSPWPWYAAAALCLVAGVVLHRAVLRRTPGSSRD